MRKQLEKSITINDIAERVGVSKTTVSRFLNGKYEYMSMETRRKIQDTIDELEYRPSLIARSLKTKQSKQIAILLHALTGQTVAQLLNGICEILNDNDYSPVVYNCAGRKELERTFIMNCVDQQVSGILLSPTERDFTAAIQTQEGGIPIVMVDRYNDDWPYDAVYVNHESLIGQMLRHLCERGYQDVAFFYSNRDIMSTKHLRLQAFTRFFSNGSAPDGCNGTVCHLRAGEDLLAEAKRAFALFLGRDSSRKKAILASDVDMLNLVLSAVKQLRIRVPEELGICGYDAWGWAKLITPAVTTIEQPLYEMGKDACQLLLSRIQGKLPPIPQVHILPGYLEIREST